MRGRSTSCPSQKQPAGGEHTPLLQQYPHHDGRPRLGPSVLDMVRVIVNYGCPREKLDDVKCVCHSTLRFPPQLLPRLVTLTLVMSAAPHWRTCLQWCRRWRRRQRSVHSATDAAKLITLLCHIALRPGTSKHTLRVGFLFKEQKSNLLVGFIFIDTNTK